MSGTGNWTRTQSHISVLTGPDVLVVIVEVSVSDFFHCVLQQAWTWLPFSRSQTTCEGIFALVILTLTQWSWYTNLTRWFRISICYQKWTTFWDVIQWLQVTWWEASHLVACEAHIYRHSSDKQFRSSTDNCWWLMSAVDVCRLDEWSDCLLIL